MKNRLYILGALVLFLLASVIYGNIDNESGELRQVSATQADNKKICWGIKRAENHEQPDLGKINFDLMNKLDGIAMGSKEKKYVYLTFDQGYEAGYTNQILDTLRDNNVKATFFITAHYLNTQGDLIKRMIEEGHIVGNHTANHKSMPDVSNEINKDEVLKLHTAMYDKFNYEMKYFRPPKGEYNQRTVELTNSMGYTTVMWSLAYDDWDENKQKGVEYAKKRILDNIHPGAVILLHGNSKDNANALEYCIKEIKSMGYAIKSLDEFEL